MIVVAIDADGAMRRVLARVLAWRGHTPLMAADRDAGLALVLAHRPAVVTLDYEIAGAPGLELADDIEAALGADAPPLVLVSASADRLPRDERRRFAALHTKPFRASALLDDVDRLGARAARKSSGVVPVASSAAVSNTVASAADSPAKKPRAENE